MLGLIERQGGKQSRSNISQDSLHTQILQLMHIQVCFAWNISKLAFQPMEYSLNNSHSPNRTSGGGEIVTIACIHHGADRK